MNKILSLRQVYMDFPFFTTNYLLMVGDPYSSSTDNLGHVKGEATALTVRDLRRKTDDLPVDGQTESPHHWTDEVESEMPESEVLSDVEEILSATSVSWEAVGIDMQR